MKVKLIKTVKGISFTSCPHTLYYQTLMLYLHQWGTAMSGDQELAPMVIDCFFVLRDPLIK